MSSLLEHNANTAIRNMRGENVFALVLQASQNTHTAFDGAYRLSVLELPISHHNEINEQDENGDTILHLAISRRLPPQAIELLLQCQADVETRNNDGFTPLYFAVFKRVSLDILDLLLEATKNINAQDKDGDTALHMAVMWYLEHDTDNQWPRSRVLDCLHQQEGKLNLRSETDGVCHSRSYDSPSYDPAEMEVLLSQVDPGQEDYRRATGRVKTLLRHGASRSISNKNGVTPTMRAYYGLESICFLKAKEVKGLSARGSRRTTKTSSSPLTRMLYHAKNIDEIVAGAPLKLR